MNEMWIKAKICEILMEWEKTHCATLIARFDPSCRKSAIEVLARMYFENHIWSSVGLIRWNRDEHKGPCLDTMETLRSMITRYCVNHGCDISELSQNSFNE